MSRVWLMVSSFWLTACAVQPATPVVNMANPASVYCVAQGGYVVLVTTTAGVRGLCHLPNGQVEDEWDYYRRMHPAE